MYIPILGGGRPPSARLDAGIMITVITISLLAFDNYTYFLEYNVIVI